MDEYTACMALDAAADDDGNAFIEGVGECRQIATYAYAYRLKVVGQRGYLLWSQSGWLVRDNNGKLMAAYIC